MGAKSVCAEGGEGEREREREREREKRGEREGNERREVRER